MTARNEVWDLLVARVGHWVTRDEIEEVGGAESMRRLREVRTTATGSDYEWQQRPTLGNLLEYRLVSKSERSDWHCAKCGTSQLKVNLQPSTDSRDRYRLGECVVCRNKQAVFTHNT